MSLEEFDKFIQKQQFALLEYSQASREGIVKMQKVGWKAALEWVIVNNITRNINEIQKELGV